MIRKYFCPRCGKTLKAQGFCKECAVEKTINETKFKDIILKICTLCNSYLNKGQWTAYNDLLNLIKQTTKKTLKGITITDIELNPPEFKKKPGTRLRFDIIINEEYVVPGVLEFSYCTKCAKSQSQYYEGILQLRDCKKQHIEYVKEELKKIKGVKISKEVFYKNGVDIYLNNNKALRSLAKKLKSKFGAEISENQQEFSIDRMTSKTIYRLNIIARFSLFRPGDVIVIDNNVIKITNMKKNMIMGYDLKTGKRVSFKKWKEKPRILEIVPSKITRLSPSIQALDSETFEPIELENQKINVKFGDKIKVVKYKGRLYAV